MSLHISSKAIEQLEFDKIQNLVGAYCKGDIGRRQLEAMSFMQEVDTLEQRLSVTCDISTMIEQGEVYRLSQYEDIEEDLFLLSKKGYVLDAESVLRIAAILRNYDSFVEHFDTRMQGLYPHLYSLGYLDSYTRIPLLLIDKVFDPNGDLRPDASTELTRIYRRIASTSRELDQVFLRILNKHKEANKLTDVGESVRSGRRVLVLPIENKRKVQGVIHDHSATGKTVYIEPQEVMALNNELYELESDKRMEIYKILKSLSDDLRTHKPLFELAFERIWTLDIALAKGAFSHRIGGSKPTLVDHPVWELQDVRHPLLMWQSIHQGGAAIPFDLHLHGSNKLLLISGPNAGGKSVTLKAIGLIHLMVYSGLMVPVHKESKIGMFSAIYTDIGDQQSIDEGLSTYSSHLTNLRDIVDQVDRRSLVLLDEIGSGTDPKLGGAIAEGILKSLIYKGAYGVVTTHYSQLKIFAFHNKGILNGAMLFDKELLTPTYRLKVGKPGSSYAFEVAKKVGLSHHVLNYARKKVGEKDNLVEDLLVDLQEGKAILDEQLAYIADEKLKLDRLIKNYDEMSKQYEVKRKKLKIKNKEIELKKANDEQHELQKLISKLEKEKNIEKARQLKDDAHAKRIAEFSSLEHLKKDVFHERNPDEEIFVGDAIKMIDSDMVGEVLRINGDRITALFGLMQMDIAMADVTLAKDQLNVNKIKHINVKGVAFENNFSPKLDIRGYKKQDAEATLQEFFDKALLNNVRTLEIVHGKGSGALRRLVLSKMKEYKDFQSHYHPDPERGGDGVTFIVV